MPENLSQNIKSLCIVGLTNESVHITPSMKHGSMPISKLKIDEDCLTKHFPNLENLNFAMPTVSDCITPNTFYHIIRNNSSILKPLENCENNLSLCDVDVFYHDPKLDRYTSFHADEVNSWDYFIGIKTIQWEGSEYLYIHSYLDLEFINITKKNELNIEHFKEYLQDNPMNTHQQDSDYTIYSNDMPVIYPEAVLLKYKAINEIRCPKILSIIKPKECLSLKIFSSQVTYGSDWLNSTPTTLPSHFMYNGLLTSTNIYKLLTIISKGCTNLSLTFPPESLACTSTKKLQKLMESISTSKSLKQLSLTVKKKSRSKTFNFLNISNKDLAKIRKILCPE